jgi:spore coat polysaccharide biosynthesis protein SpsF
MWRGDFGGQYTGRNQVNWAARVPFWKRIREEAGPMSYLEVGCNAGWNMRAIREGYDSNDPGFEISGVDVNVLALQQAKSAGLHVEECPAKRIVDIFGEGVADMVFTVGVLIHIPPEDLDEVLDQMIKVSKRHILVAEYYAAEERGITYQGHADLLWKRPWDKLLEAKELSLALRGELDAKDGFDKNGLTYFLFEK